MFEGDDGRMYESEAAWEFAYAEGCKAEMQRIWAAEAADWGDDDDDFIGPVRPYVSPYADDEIPF
jgi:hypothetical protein